MSIIADSQQSIGLGRDNPFLPVQRLLLHDVTWDNYLAIGNALGDRPALRLTYDRGSLEFMVTSSQHEIYKRWLSRLIEALTEECNQPIVAAGNMTFQREDLERGLEADDCFWIAQEPACAETDVGSRHRSVARLALEIEISRMRSLRMNIYAALGVPEVWRFDGTTLRVERWQAASHVWRRGTQPFLPGHPYPLTSSPSCNPPPRWIR